MSDTPAQRPTPVSPGPSVVSELSRDLKLHHVVMMGLGMMIGAGVFVGIGFATRGAGPGGLMMTFVLNGLIALFTAMSFAELSSAIPRAGGAYNFARIGFGRGASFIAGWTEWFASSLAGAFYAVVFAEYSLAFLNEALNLGWNLAEHHWPVNLLAVVAAASFVYVNYRGSSETGKLGAIFTGLQMLFVVSIGVIGVVTLFRHPQRLENFQPFLTEGGWWKLLGTMGVIYVAFEGFEVIAQAGDETIDPKRNLPKAMLYSVLIVTVTYLLVALASVVAIHGTDQSVAAYAESIESGGGSFFKRSVQHLIPYGGFLVTLAVIFSSTSALNATIYSATQTSFALGRDSILPPAFARLSARRKTPYVALAFTAVIVLTAATFLDPEHGAAAASMMFLCLFFMVNLCAIRIRLHMGDELEYGFVMPLFPLFPLLAIVCQIALAGGIFGESLPAIILAAIWVPVGAGIYLFYSRSRAPVADHEITVLEEAREPTGDEYAIMVSVADPANALGMVRTTYRLAQAKAASLQLLHMVPVPPQVPLSDAHQYMQAGREGMAETMLYLAPMFEIATNMRYCRNIARGILSAVRDKRVDLLILGWHGRTSGRVFKLGSTIDPIIERCPCNVIVLKECGGNREFRRVLVPVGGGPYSAYSLEVASILAEDDGEITALTVARPGQEPLNLEAFIAEHANRLKLPRDRIIPKVVESPDVAETILSQASEHDLVVIGSTREPLLRQVTHLSLPELIAQRCDTPLAMVKESGRIRSWIKRWI